MSRKTSEGPAKGLWICRPAEDGMAARSVAYVILRWFIWLLCLLIALASVRYAPPHLYLIPIVAVVFSAVVAFIAWAKTRRAIRKRIIDDRVSDDSKERSRDGFYIAIDFRDGNIPTADMKSRVEWSMQKNSESQPESEKPYPLVEGGVEAMQSLLPRLNNLQRIAGSDASIKIQKKPSQGGWQFSFQRGPGTTFGLWCAVLCALLAALLLLVAFIMFFHPNLSVSIACSIGVVLSLVLAFERRHRLRLPSRLQLDLKPRTKEEDVFDMRWSSYHGPIAPMHDQWALLTHAKGVDAFCGLASKFSNDVNSTGFEDVELKKLASEKYGPSPRQIRSATSSFGRGQFNLRPVF